MDRCSRSFHLAPASACRGPVAACSPLPSTTPAIAHGMVYVSATDQGDGNTGGVVALDLLTGAIRWRTTTPRQIRGGPAVEGDTVAAAQLDGTVLGLDAATGEIRWRSELGAGL